MYANFIPAKLFNEYNITELEKKIPNSGNAEFDSTKDDLNYLDIATKNAYNNMVLEDININNLEENVYNYQNSTKIILDLKKFNKENKAIQKRVILYSITRLFGTAQGIERIHVEDMIKLCNNNIGNKYLTPNKNTKIVIKNKKIILERLK